MKHILCLQTNCMISIIPPKNKTVTITSRALYLLNIELILSTNYDICTRLKQNIEITETTSNILPSSASTQLNSTSTSIEAEIALFSNNPSYMWLLLSDMWLLLSDMWLLLTDMWLLLSNMWLLLTDMWLLHLPRKVLN